MVDAKTQKAIKDLMVLKVKLLKLNTLIKIESKEEDLKVLKQLKADLEYQIDIEKRALLSHPENKDYNLHIIKTSDENRLCLAYYTEHERYYYAFISNIDVDEQICRLKFIGYDETREMNSYNVKLQTNVSKDKIRPGYECSYVNPDNGKLTPCVIVNKLNDENTQIKNLQTTETIDIEDRYIVDHVFPQNNKSSREFVAPDDLKILPSDTQQVRMIKKKKLKKLKYNFKTEKMNEFFNEKKNTWQNFAKKISHNKF